MPYFKDLPSAPDFPALEKDILKLWADNNIVQQYLHRNDSSSKTFSFIDGPITANNPMGVHHARGRTLKDVFQRYKNSQGFAQRFQNGFDCQGLWVEVEVEKEAGFNSKKDIQNFGIDNFTNTCLSRVNKYAVIQTEQSKRLGMFMDWDNSYYTNSKTNNLYIWYFLKTIWQKGWLVRKKSAATWCPRCETGLSQHEQADGYKEITDTSVYLKFKIKNRNNEYALAWTTTPWTLSANVLLAINTKHQYVRVKHSGQTLYLAQQAADRLGLTSYQLIDSKTLLNLEYESLYQTPEQLKAKHYITDWPLVDPVEGTGIVHIAPGCGQEDFELGKSLHADMIAPLDERGYFVDGFGDLSGHYAHDVTPIVLAYLERTKSLFKTEPVTHRYPHCWRCKTKCLFRLEDSWYIKSDQIRPLLQKAAKTVNWHPKYTLRRMLNWLDTMEDWMISRKRFYGLALPFYPCPACGQLTVIDSLTELKTNAVNPNLVDSLPSLHRPWIDQIEIKCPKCRQPVKRIPDVGDCWLDAGVVPFSTLKYLEDRSYWQKWFPADLVLEMIEQIRLWFYSMLFFSVTFENTSPYKNVVSHAEVRDEKGERMSKTKKNGIPYDQAIDKMGADAMRWLYCQQKPHANVNFGFNIADQVKKGFFLILWNSYRFYTQHANLDNWQPSDNFSPDQSTNLLDRWIVSRLHSTIASATKHLEKFNTSQTTLAIEDFVNDLSTWYIRRNRDRSDNYSLLFYLFDNLIKLTSPIIPFISEIIYQNLTLTVQSVHLENWPTADRRLIDPDLEIQMSLARNLCQLIHSQRQKSGIKIRQPLSSATLILKQPLLPNFLSIISDETNVKQIKLETGEETPRILLDTNLTPELITEGEYRDLVRKIQVLRKETNLAPKDKIKIHIPVWPKAFENEILQKTLAVSIEKSDSFRIEKI